VSYKRQVHRAIVDLIHPATNEEREGQELKAEVQRAEAKLENEKAILAALNAETPKPEAEAEQVDEQSDTDTMDPEGQRFLRQLGEELG